MKNRLIILSDLHIGTNHNTNWYQSSFHEPYLLAILDYVKNNSRSIDELIILGDLFDQWTYPANMEPPSFEKIVMENRNIFGDIISGGNSEGALGEVLSALEGRVTYINGNHDMSVMPDKINLTTKSKYKFNTYNGLVYVPETGGGRIACTHGHIFSLFNAPDYANAAENLGGLPLGYFMARLASQWTSNMLEKNYPAGATTADMPDGGIPSGPGFNKSAIAGCIKEALSGNSHLSDLVMGAQLEAAGFNKKDYIRLPENKKIRASEVAGIYKKLTHTFPSCPGIPEKLYGSDPALFALTTADIKNSLSHFAGHLGENHKLVIMGHTHEFEEDSSYFIFQKSSLYANSGFCCPSKPDMGLKDKKPEKVRLPTFIEARVDEKKSRFTVDIKAVIDNNGNYSVIPCPGARRETVKW